MVPKNEIELNAFSAFLSTGLFGDRDHKLQALVLENIDADTPFSVYLKFLALNDSILK